MGLDWEGIRFHSAAEGLSAQRVLLVRVAFDCPPGTFNGGRDEGYISVSA